MLGLEVPLCSLPVVRTLADGLLSGGGQHSQRVKAEASAPELPGGQLCHMLLVTPQASHMVSPDSRGWRDGLEPWRGRVTKARV